MKCPLKSEVSSQLSVLSIRRFDCTYDLCPIKPIELVHVFEDEENNIIKTGYFAVNIN